MPKFWSLVVSLEFEIVFFFVIIFISYKDALHLCLYVERNKKKNKNLLGMSHLQTKAVAILVL